MRKKKSFSWRVNLRNHIHNILRGAYKKGDEKFIMQVAKYLEMQGLNAQKVIFKNKQESGLRIPFLEQEVEKYLLSNRGATIRDITLYFKISKDSASDYRTKIYTRLGVPLPKPGPRRKLAP